MLNNTVWHNTYITKEQRAEQKKQKPCVIWFTGLSGSGKSTLANALEQKLFELGYHTYLLDGDNIRHGLNNDLGFSIDDRKENIRRISEVAKLFVDAGLIVLTAFISPFKSDRKFAMSLVGKENFIEVFIDASVQICEKRDPKGLYKKARKGMILDFTGINSTYEIPEQPDIHIKTDKISIERCADKIVKYFFVINLILPRHPEACHLYHKLKKKNAHALLYYSFLISYNRLLIA